MKNLLHIVIAVLLLLAAVNSSSLAQQQQQQTTRREIDKKFRAETVDSLLRLLREKYVYPEIAVKMDEAVRARLGRGEYDSISDGKTLAEKITADLRAVFDDKHLKLSYSAEPIAANSSRAGAPSAAEIEAARRRQSRENFGATRVEILKGNVGFIKLNYFAPLDWSANAYASAMNFVADTDALIIDVRENRGSMDINAVPFFCSFLFREPVQLGDVFWRETNETRQLWTYAQVPGRKYAEDKPVYVLTSRRTASGAEGFVRHLKRLKRAVLVGEATMGATMPGMSHRVNEHFSVWISLGRSASGNAAGENKGTEPDIAVEPEKAPDAAHLRAINQILQTASDEEWKNHLKTVAAEIEGRK
ncbi:MAG: S41 family peptidase [Acidobacteriota bacterium]|nr:S41 family peptidase [Acidobacteriota bacterium]